MERYSQHAAPLNLLTRKNTPFFWGEPQEISFQYYYMVGGGLIYIEKETEWTPLHWHDPEKGSADSGYGRCDVAVGSVLPPEPERVESAKNIAQSNYYTTQKRAAG